MTGISFLHKAVISMWNFYFYGKLLDNGKRSYPVSIYLFKVNNRNTRERCEICSKSWVNNENTRTMSITLFSTVSIVLFEQVNVSWVNTDDDDNWDYYTKKNRKGVKVR